MKRAELEPILAVMRACAREAGALVLGGFRKRHVIEHKSAAELVTRFDRESEALLRERLSASFAFDIVGEEGGGDFRRDRPAFFVDPIDGTTNFVHGHPFWCVSIGLVIDGEPALGVVFAPALGQEWYAFVGDDAREARRRMHAAWRPEGETDEPIAVSTTAELEHSLLATGFPYDRRKSPDNNFDAFVAIKKRCQAVRRCGSAALDLCLVADGTYEGYWERKLRPWDIAAGIAIVRAAGGTVTELEPTPEGPIASGHLVATNGLIHDALLHELAHAPALSIAPPG
ncbi:MAG: inositol monophosphatase [Labilithrix sp.]|nr:inositol monophosphatase [Labilithrix sp.]